MTHVTSFFIRAKPGLSDELGQTLMALIAPTRSEDGCISHDMFRSKDDPELWMLFEECQSAEHLDAHFRQAHMQAFVARKPELVEGDFDMRTFTCSADAS